MHHMLSLEQALHSVIKSQPIWWVCVWQLPCSMSGPAASSTPAKSKSAPRGTSEAPDSLRARRGRKACTKLHAHTGPSTCLAVCRIACCRVTCASQSLVHLYASTRDRVAPSPQEWADWEQVRPKIAALAREDVACIRRRGTDGLPSPSEGNMSFTSAVLLDDTRHTM